MASAVLGGMKTGYCGMPFFTGCSCWARSPARSPSRCETAIRTSPGGISGHSATSRCTGTSLSTGRSCGRSPGNKCQSWKNRSWASCAQSFQSSQRHTSQTRCPERSRHLRRPIVGKLRPGKRQLPARSEAQGPIRRIRPDRACPDQYNMPRSRQTGSSRLVWSGSVSLEPHGAEVVSWVRSTSESRAVARRLECAMVGSVSLTAKAEIAVTGYRIMARHLTGLTGKRQARRPEGTGRPVRAGHAG